MAELSWGYHFQLRQQHISTARFKGNNRYLEAASNISSAQLKRKEQKQMKILLVFFSLDSSEPTVTGR
jgi:hypothetical protein